MNNCSARFLKGSDVPVEQVDRGVVRQLLGYDPSILMAKASFDEGSVGYVHSHVHAQTTYVESGVFEVNIDGVLQTLVAGDAFYVPPNVNHGAVCKKAGVLIDVFSPIRADFFEPEKNS